MPAIMTLDLTAKDNIRLPGLGLVTGTVVYGAGYPGTYWDPPEPAEVIIESLRDAFGIAVPDEYWDDHEDDYEALCDQVGALVDAEVSAGWADLTVTEDGFDADLPF